jgi:hypothetical protein
MKAVFFFGSVTMVVMSVVQALLFFSQPTLCSIFGAQAALFCSVAYLIGEGEK